jgi:hypothetical protein
LNGYKNALKVKNGRIKCKNINSAPKPFPDIYLEALGADI